MVFTIKFRYTYLLITSTAYYINSENTDTMTFVKATGHMGLPSDDYGSGTPAPSGDAGCGGGCVLSACICTPDYCACG